ncbi:unnamed protein product [Rotaria magnacalcarata]|uniref:Integrase catalytic domain-containing protein n=2 Tax=Rotaria magnacalcarata TaxID=392030 RepID=A0A816SLX2_9BILA|nr:unnamed protein product [Rotaria magnacalcarata]
MFLNHKISIRLCELIYATKYNLPLIPHEKIYEKIYECHIAVGHSGRDKTWAEIKTRYAGIPQQTISIFINMCDVCQTRRSFPKATSGKPIISVGFLTRLQVDLIDMRSMKHDGFNFIMHAKDHFTKFSWLFALPSKEAHHVALHLRNLFYTFGPPKILQSDNGKEFVANIILDLKLNWLDLIIINGRPRHPQSQGLVERANAVVQKMLGKWLETNKSLDWPQGLGSVMLAMNNCISQSTKKTPYEMVFGQSVRNDHDFWLQLHQQSINKTIIDEEELPESLADNFNLNDHSVRINIHCLLVTNIHLYSFSKLIDNNSEYADACSPIPILSSNTYLLQNDKNDHLCHEYGHFCLANGRLRNTNDHLYYGTGHFCHKNERQLNNYQRGLKKQKVFQVGDIVVLKIADVDRSNTAPSILPCKIVETITKEENINTMYKVASLNGIITNLFSASDFTDLSETISTDLRQLNSNTLPVISFIQACQIFTQYKSVQACKCAGSCNTNRCPCKKQSVKCCTKCHRGKNVLCKNCI